MIQLLKQLVQANEAYRNGDSIMSDAAYDAASDKLADLVASGPANNPDVIAARNFLASIGATPSSGSGWAKVTHSQAMTSLEKAQTQADFIAWADSLPQGSCKIWSEKLDGFSLKLGYSNGVLNLAATRGDGDAGEDITRNALKMKGVVTHINGFTGEVRGEVVLRKTDFQKHFPNGKNPRNVAAGVAKRHDGVGCEHLTFIAYQFLRVGGMQVARKEQEFALLQKLGFAVPNYGVGGNAEIIRVRDQYDRDSLDYLIDGLVVEADDLSVAAQLGFRNHRPAASIAYKFEHETAISRLVDLIWQVGKSGRVTPVAVFDTVELAGASISRASLHNISNIKTMATPHGRSNFAVGDQIIVSRRNDVIPYVEDLLLLGGGPELPIPDRCPECGTPLVRDGEYIVCRGEDCPAQVVGMISRWVKKINVLGLGDAVISALVDAGKINDPADLYTMQAADIESVMVGGSRLGQTAYTIVQELHSKKDIPLYMIVGSLGIPLCSRSVCRTIEEAGFDSLSKMRLASVASISKIPKMGDTKALSFLTGLKARNSLIDKLLSNGIRIKVAAVGSLTGVSVCFTGVRDPSLEVAIEAAGGAVKGSVGKGLTYLVAKDPTASSGKLDKARQQGTAVVSLAEMRKLVQG